MRRPVSEARLPAYCLICGAVGSRIFTAPPVALLGRPVRNALDREEASGHAPEVTTAKRGRPLPHSHSPRPPWVRTTEPCDTPGFALTCSELCDYVKVERCCPTQVHPLFEVMILAYPYLSAGPVIRHTAGSGESRATSRAPATSREGREQANSFVARFSWGVQRRRVHTETLNVTVLKG